MYALLTQELQCLIDILEAMNSHFAFGWSRQTLAGQDLKELYQVFTITHVDI
jgi:hypothetical protein